MLLTEWSWLTSPNSAYVYKTQASENSEQLIASESSRDDLRGRVHPHPGWHGKSTYLIWDLLPLTHGVLATLTHTLFMGVG